MTARSKRPGVRIAALADLHLGYQAYHATSNGRNTREEDVERAFDSALDLILARRPAVDLVTIAGDVFHTLRPSNRALLVFRDGCRKLTGAGLPVVAIAGNHDSARTAATRSPIEIPGDLPGYYAVTCPRTVQLELRGLAVAIHCVPDSPLAATSGLPKAEPDPTADVNILLAHAPVRSSARPDALPYHYAGSWAPDIAAIADRFDVIHLGDYHEYQGTLVPGRSVFYSGATERTSSNIWIERNPKGVVFLDTAHPGALELAEFPTRRMFNINLVDDLGEEPTAATINQHLLDALNDESVAGSIFRLVVPNLPRSERSAIDRTLERSLKGHALHFQLDTRSPEGIRDPAIARSLREGKTLEAAARAHFAQYEPEVRNAALALLGIQGTPADVPDVYAIEAAACA